ncbi:MAG TPA: hypothetical protein DDW85_08920 [Porphyromonadaceae bacterium]|jgi:hypothetical protein|nr:hypothetical protein [Porphyromonadaceae bacterium]
MQNVFPNQNHGFLIWLLAIVLSLGFSACDETDEYYEVLKKQPELVGFSATGLNANDILVIYGRFNPDDLEIRIGDIEKVKIESIDTVDLWGSQFRWDYSYLAIKVIITNEMGIGKNRPVTITSSGITVENIPLIEIRAQYSLLEKPLTLEKVADVPANNRPVYCNNGKGNFYFFHDTEYKLTRISPDGGNEQVFDKNIFKDNDGVTFRITRVDGIGIDPQERYVYLSAYTRALTGQPNHYYRLCRYDLNSGQWTVLNKTAYSTRTASRTLEATQPFEGNVGEAKIFTVTGVYPDKEGNVYFNMDNRFITRLDAAGNYNILSKNSNYADSPQMEKGVPVINGYTDEELLNIIPGTVDSFTNVDIIHPEGNEFYTSSVDGFYRHSLTGQKRINGFDNRYTRFSGAILYYAEIIDGRPYTTGYFNSSEERLTGRYSRSDTDNSVWGRLPLADGKLLVLYNYPLATAYIAWGVLDFSEERGYHYSPGQFDPMNYKVNFDDVLIKYDDEGHVYFTANNRQVILKTVYK